jgi:heat shock protein HtpX
MAKRILLFLATNFAILVVVGGIMAVLQNVGVVPALDVGYFAGLFGLCLLYGMVGSFISLALSRWVAKTFMGVQLIGRGERDRKLARVYSSVEQLSQKAGLPMPEVGWYDSDEVNAFATGPGKNKALVAVSAGLLNKMRPDEVDGVLAHEVAHVANGDMVTMTLLQGIINAFVMFFARLVAMAAQRAVDRRLSRLVGWIAYMLALLVFGLLGSLITNWFSRAREFKADAGGANYAGRDKMIAALRRLQSSHESVDAESHPSMNAFKISGRSKLSQLFSTHPPLETRIARLEGRMR